MRIVTDNSGLPAALALLLVFSCTCSADLVQNAPVVEDLPQLRSLLRTAQWMLLPRDTPGVFDLGSYAFTPTNPISGDEWLDLSNGGFDIPLALWIYEDARSADTVFVNVENLRSVTLPPEPGYTPFWVYENALSGLNPGDIPPLEWHAPSLVSITLTLRPPSSTLDADDSFQPGDSTPTAQSPGTPLNLFAAATTLDVVPDALRESPAPPFDVLAAPGAAALVAGTASASQTTNASTVAEGLLVPPPGIHVGGNGTMDGESLLSPLFPTLAEGLAELNARGGGALVVHEGLYRDDIDVRGRAVLVRFKGDVTLVRAAPAQACLPEETAGGAATDFEIHSPTGAVAVADQWEGR